MVLIIIYSFHRFFSKPLELLYQLLIYEIHVMCLYFMCFTFIQAFANVNFYFAIFRVKTPFLFSIDLFILHEKYARVQNILSSR